MTDADRLDDIKEKLHKWGYLSLFPEAEQDVTWLLEELEKREEDIAKLQERVKRNEWIDMLP